MFKPLFLVAASSLISLGQGTPQKILVGSAEVETIRSYTGPPLAKPAAIQIENVDVPPEVVTVDQSAAARLSARRAARQGQEPDTTPEAAAQHVAESFSSTLIEELEKTSIPVSRADGAESKDVLLVRIEFMKIDQGNKTKRVMVGFGRGASDVQAHVTLLLTTGEQLAVVSEFKLNSVSGKKPGAAATMGAGAAAAGAAAGSVGDKKETVEGDASRMAKAVAKQIEDLMVAQNWIPAPPAK